MKSARSEAIPRRTASRPLGSFNFSAFLARFVADFWPFPPPMVQAITRCYAGNDRSECGGLSHNQQMSKRSPEYKLVRSEMPCGPDTTETKNNTSNDSLRTSRCVSEERCGSERCDTGFSRYASIAGWAFAEQRLPALCCTFRTALVCHRRRLAYMSQT